MCSFNTSRPTALLWPQRLSSFCVCPEHQTKTNSCWLFWSRGIKQKQTLLSPLGFFPLTILLYSWCQTWGCVSTGVWLLTWALINCHSDHGGLICQKPWIESYLCRITLSRNVCCVLSLDYIKDNKISSLFCCLLFTPPLTDFHCCQWIRNLSLNTLRASALRVILQPWGEWLPAVWEPTDHRPALCPFSWPQSLMWLECQQW